MKSRLILPILLNRFKVSDDEDETQLIAKQANAGPKPFNKNYLSKELKQGNLIMAIVHTTVFVFIMVTSRVVDPPYTMFIDSIWTDTEIAPPLHDTWCCRTRPNECVPTPGIGKNGETYGTCDVDVTSTCETDCECLNHTDWRAWFECESRYVSDWVGQQPDEVRLYSPVIDNIAKIRVWVLLAIFEFITAFFHTSLYFMHGTYMFFVKRKMQPWRWTEYHITSAIMTMAVASLSRITEIGLLSALFLLQAYINFTGGLVFELMGDLLTTSRCPKRKIVYRFVRWWLYGMSVLAFAHQFYVIFSAFYSIIDPYFELQSGEMWKKLFGFVEIVNFGLFATYLTFPLIHFYHLVGEYFGDVHYYEHAEMGYIVASFVSKLLLVGTIFYAAIERENETNSS